MTGTDFILKVILNLRDQNRENKILEAFQQGHTPLFMKNFQRVKLESPRDFQNVQWQRHGMKAVVKAISLEITPDYLCIGTDSDYVRIPMFPGTAQQVADKYGCLLPTPRIVEMIEKQAHCLTLPHEGLRKDQQYYNKYQQKHGGKDVWDAYAEYMKSSEACLVHNEQIKKHWNGSPGRLVSGHKKDIVLAADMKDKVVIYDWPKNGTRSVHGSHHAKYVDYSHGVRLVKKDIVLDFGGWGDIMPLADALKDPELARALNKNMTLIQPKYGTE